MDARVSPAKQKFLPALAEQLALWFPEVGGRALAVSEVSITKDNVPTLPLVMTAFIRSTADPNEQGNLDNFEITDTFIVDFWLEPARYKKSNGTETPFWSYYDYEQIRDTLLWKMGRWDPPGCEMISFRGMTIEAEPLAVTLTFTFMAYFRWVAPRVLDEDVQIIGSIPVNVCAPLSDCCDPECLDEKDPCP
jgi:hypothetical protein